jgi:tetratricopeptide (TPR) repeat protein
VTHSYDSPDQRAIRALLVAGAVLVAIGLLGGALPGVGDFFGLFVPGGLFLLVVAGGVFVAQRTAGEALARLLTNLYGASGATTPAPKGYSAIEALVARGAYADAAAAYRAEITREPRDVEARVRLAELLLSRLDAPAEAAALYAEARDLAADQNRRIGLTLRLVDIQRDRLKDRGRAIVELRRLVDSYPNSRHTAGARSELARLLSQAAEARPS